LSTAGSAAQIKSAAASKRWAIWGLTLLIKGTLEIQFEGTSMNLHLNIDVGAASKGAAPAAVLKRPLNTNTESICTKLSIPDLIIEITKKSDNADEDTVRSAMQLRELRLRVKAGELGPNVNWYEYALRAVQLGKSRLKELDRIARAKDPHHELNRLRKLAVERAKTFDRKNEVSPDQQMRNKVVYFAKTAPIAQVQRLFDLMCEMPKLN